MASAPAPDADTEREDAELAARESEQEEQRLWPGALCSAATNPLPHCGRTSLLEDLWPALAQPQG